MSTVVSAFANFGGLTSFAGLAMCSTLLLAAFLERVWSLARRDISRDAVDALGLFGCFAWVGAAAPLFGILGTVFGIMIAFGRGGAGDAVQVDDVLRGIAIALSTTAIGLVEALVALVGRALFHRATELAWTHAASAQDA